MNWLRALAKPAGMRKPWPVSHQFRPRLEGLESRVVPYTASGNFWPNPQLVTISFMPDGTNLGGVSSNLFSSFNGKFGSASTWENVVLKAAQQWAQQTNLNFAVVADSGAPAGSGSYQQGDPTFGDIRIGGYNFGTSSLAAAYMPPAVNNYSIAGDITFNTAQPFNIGSTYDLYTVALHEFGHALGLLGSSTISAAQYETYSGTKCGLASDDVAGIQSIYGGARKPDVYGSLNGSFGAAADVTGSMNPSTRTALITGLDITRAGEKDYYRVTAPAGTAATVTVSAQSSGLSLLAPTLTVYAADQKTVLGSATGAGTYGTALTVTLTNKVTAGQTMYVQVGGADNTALGTGAYALTMSFGGAPLPSVPAPNTQVLNGSPRSGGGGQAQAQSQDYMVNTFNNGSQQTFPQSPEAVAMDARGNYVVTWSSQNQDGQGWGVYAQRFDAAGNPLGGEFLVNTTTAGDQEYSTVAMDPNGDFIISWSSHGGNQPGTQGWDVFARRYNASGSPLGSEFLVNTTTADDQMYSTVAMDANGDSVITWSSHNQDGQGWGVFARRYDATGSAVGGEFLVNTTTADDQMYSTVAMDANGDGVITWSSHNQDGQGWGVYAQRYDATGKPLGKEFLVNTTTAGDQEYSTVAMDGTGDFVITWSSHGGNQLGTQGWDVFARRYNASGSPLGSEFLVNSTTAGDQMYSTVAMNAGGAFVVTWSSNGGNQPGSNGWDVFAQQFDGSGSPEGTEFMVNTTAAGDQHYSSVARDGMGHIVVAWSGNGAGNTRGVLAERFVIGADALAASEADDAPSEPAAQGVRREPAGDGTAPAAEVPPMVLAPVPPGGAAPEPEPRCPILAPGGAPIGLRIACWDSLPSGSPGTAASTGVKAATSSAAPDDSAQSTLDSGGENETGAPSPLDARTPSRGEPAQAASAMAARGVGHLGSQWCDACFADAEWVNALTEAVADPGPQGHEIGSAPAAAGISLALALALASARLDPWAASPERETRIRLAA